MSTRLLAAIEQNMNQFLEAECEAEDWPTVWVPDNLANKMAVAAYQVFRANQEAQEFAKAQDNDR